MKRPKLSKGFYKKLLMGIFAFWLIFLCSMLIFPSEAEQILYVMEFIELTVCSLILLGLLLLSWAELRTRANKRAMGLFIAFVLWLFIFVSTYFAFFWFRVDESNWRFITSLSLLSFIPLVVLGVYSVVKVLPTEVLKLKNRRKSKVKHTLSFIARVFICGLVLIGMICHSVNIMRALSEGIQLYEGNCFRNYSHGAKSLFPGRRDPRWNQYIVTDNEELIFLSFEDYKEIGVTTKNDYNGIRYECVAPVSVYYIPHIEMFGDGYALSVSPL